jgi:hypothetical protein
MRELTEEQDGGLLPAGESASVPLTQVLADKGCELKRGKVCKIWLRPLDTKIPAEGSLRLIPASCRKPEPTNQSKSFAVLLHLMPVAAG